MQVPQPIHPDIAKASTLPGSFYGDPDIYKSLLEKVIAPGWQWIGQSAELKPGQARPFTLLPGSLEEPLVLVRDAGGTLRCLSNVCTHRGCTVQESPGPCKSLRCNYHGRKFDLDGRMTHMPAFEKAVDFPREEDHLPRLALGSVCNALFTSIAPTQDFEDWIAPMQPLLETLPQSDFEFVPERSETFDVASHWALYVDNFLEGFHIPYVHPGLAGVLVDDQYETQLFPNGSLQVGVARPGESCFDPAQTIGKEDRPIAAYYFWLTPTTMFNFYPWGLSVNVVEPLSPGRTRVQFHSYVWRPELLDRGAGNNLDLVQKEDEDVVERVQRGLRSRLYGRGRFSPTKEQGVHQFHRMLVESLRSCQALA